MNAPKTLANMENYDFMGEQNETSREGFDPPLIDNVGNNSRSRRPLI